MKQQESRPKRGRPPTITLDRITETGIKIGLKNITFTGVAAALGVSHMALYKHVPSIEELKQLIAEEIFQRWDIPQTPNYLELQDYLTAFATSVQQFVKTHPGVTPYVIRRLAATPSMLDKINNHQQHIAKTYQISMEQARWLLATVAFHGLAVADTVYSVAEQELTIDANRTEEETEMEKELSRGMKALIIGALDMIKSNEPPEKR
ncbi:TetR/AcrR family transcriptional regulator [Oceanospirillum linum]|uniref:TetR family transcriptional regulator n=1 Tax=Oceanospirillum linum TaxID=966 RepID=A0A1T1HD72_OCELI|nr:TetR/AcrR family transcriptional regulator [Oceanospirillum linum]OOV87801.1 TetR family transcriptional regulator [Oceanospirillum linum]SEG11850.1 DNA-binding transcriptional regulator, AcrR family [Oleiphilus messinensis]SMP09323.1 DNA-binding transcriptional regulator, AcrR family [Oceanospirillum linum]